MADNARAKRLADLIREVVAQKLQRGIKDPRLGSTSPSRTPGSRVTCGRRPSSTRCTATTRSGRPRPPALESAKGVLRSEVGAAAGVKFTPTLTFVPDALPGHRQTIEDLLDKARQSDAKVREAPRAPVRR